MIEKIRKRFRNMKREGLLLNFIIGLYLVYTASNVYRGLDENPGNHAVFYFFIVLFALVGSFLILMCGYHLLRLFYLNEYLAQREAERTRLEAGGPENAQQEKKMTGVQKYLEFMYRVFRIREQVREMDENDPS